MGQAILGGALQKKWIDAHDVIISRTSEAGVQEIKDRYGVQGTTDPAEVAGQADILILAMKPQQFETVIPAIRDAVKKETLVISIAAGQTIDQILDYFGKDVHLIRTMPNTPALVGAGATGMCLSPAVTEEEARSWAESLIREKATGWTRTSYRYRVYKIEGQTYVTVIDQSRELLPCYRILIISAIGLVLGMIVSCIALFLIGKKLFQPLEEADRKQKRFIADAEKEFKAPLTIINANTEIMERETGETEQTQSIDRQIKKMIGLVKNLSNIGVFDEKNLTMLRCDIAELAQAVGDAMKSQFEEQGRALTVTADQPVTIVGDSEAMNDLFMELLNNQLKFSVSHAEMKVCQEEGHSVISAANDTNLPDGTVDQVFDRFTRLDNAKDIPGAGLGLSHVKEIVHAHNGRANAKVEYGVFTLRISL